MASRALPSHLKPSAAEGGEGGFLPRHHGKSQSHVVSCSLFLPSYNPLLLFTVRRGYRLPTPASVLQPGFALSELLEALYATGQKPPIQNSQENCRGRAAIQPWLVEQAWFSLSTVWLVPVVFSGLLSARPTTLRVTSQLPHEHLLPTHANLTLLEHANMGSCCRLSRTHPPMLPLRKCATLLTSLPMASPTPRKRR